MSWRHVYGHYNIVDRHCSVVNGNWGGVNGLWNDVDRHCSVVYKHLSDVVWH